MRILGFLQASAVVIGIIAVIAGRFFHIPTGIHVGIFLVGAGLALAGLDSIFSRLPAFFPSLGNREAYSGLPALLWGVVLLIVGGAIIASAYLLHEGQWQATLRLLERRPGALLAGGGVIAACIGLLLMLNPRGRRGVWWTLFARIPKALLGFILLAGGLAAVCLGAWEWLQPQEYQRFARDLRARLDPQLLVRWWQGLPLPWR